ncbi:MAG: type IV pilus secretin PilQ [Vicinamibacteria bacterium]
MRVAISLSIGLALGVLALPAQARQATVAARTVLADLRQETGDSSTRLVIAGSAKPTFTHHSPDPLTLVVDIADADSSRLPARLEVATREVESLRVTSLARGDGRTTARVEVRLAALAPFTVEESGNDIIITVSRASAGKAIAAPSEALVAPAPDAPMPMMTEPTRNPVPAKAASARKSSSAKAVMAKADESAPRATRISGVTKLEGDHVGYHVEGNGTLRPETFFLKNPNRLVVDFPDVVTTRTQALPTAVSPVKGLRLAQFSAAPPRVARLVLDVEGSTPYHLVPDATGVSIVFGEGTPATTELLGAPAKATVATPAEPVIAPAIAPSVTMVQQREPVALETPRSIQTTNMAPAVTMGASMKPGVVIEPISQAAPQMVPTTASLVRGSARTCGEPPFLGDPVSLDFKDGDLIDLFRLMSEISGLNIIVNPGIAGKVSLTVKEVPWDQALSLVLKTQNLGCVIDGNVVRIASLDTLKAEVEKMKQLAKEKELAGDLVSTPPARLSYLDTDQVKTVIEKTILSDRGTFTPLGTGNVYVIKDLPDRVAAAQRLIIDLDRPSAQVEIEARIVVTTRNFSRQLGVQWGFLQQQIPQLGNTTNLGFPNAVVLNGQGVQSLGGIAADQGTLASNAGIGTAGRGYLVNLPAAGLNTGIGISLGNILGSFNLDAALTAAENSGRARIISTPRITTQNKVEAEIKQGVQLPYQTVSNGTVTVAFKDAGLSMKVTPQITDAGTVFMKVVVDNSTPDFGRALPGGVPINTQSASTSVLVKDGATTVIGGIYQGQETLSRENTPFLSQIPLLGLLFKNSNTQSTNNELLIFITPRIVR